MSPISRQTRRVRQLEAAVARVSLALRKLVIATGSQLGGDCVMHATLGRTLLEELGFGTRRVVGYAAWQLGTGRADVLGHHPSDRPGPLPPATAGTLCHVWLLGHGCIIDLTTYQLEWKARRMEAADGVRTQVLWCPDFLVLPVERTRSRAAVAKSTQPGMAWYEARPELDSAAHYTIDPEDLANLRRILANPGVQVRGRYNPGGVRTLVAEPSAMPDSGRAHEHQDK